MLDNSKVPHRRNHRSVFPGFLILVGQFVFAHRTLVGLFPVVVAALFVRPTYPKSTEELMLKVISVGLVMAGVVLRAWSAGCAGKHTRTPNIEGGKLATGGPYAFVRNPIYVGSMVLGVGMVGIIGDWRLIPFCIGTFAALYFLIIPAEEEFLQRTYPLEYKLYRKNVRRILPRFRPWPGAQQTSFDWQAALGEWQMAVVLVAILAFLFGASFLRG
jgi:protein-S-isoprenylcysteine O-methyltransferase Ste14